MSFLQRSHKIIGISLLFILTGCVTPGGGKTASKGAVAGASVVNADNGLERCDNPLGTLILDDSRDKEWHEVFTGKTKVSSIEPLIRLTVMQSNCFVITASSNHRTDKRLLAISQHQRNSDEFRAGSGFQAGQRVAGDYFLESSIILNNEQLTSMSSGAEMGASAGLAGLVLGGVAGAIMANVDKKVSVVTMSLFDIRSGVQLAMAEGSSTATNFSGSIKVLGDNASANLRGYSRTPEGVATVTAFVDAYNNMVVALRNYKTQEVQGGLGRGGQLTVGQ